MKRHLSLLLVAVLMLALVACGSSKKEEEVIPENETVEERNERIMGKYKNSISINTGNFLNDLEKKETKQSLSDKSGAVVVVYSSEPVHDKSGVEFPYSFMVQSKFTIKATGDIISYIMTIGYKEEEDIKNYKGYCIQYFSETGKELNVMRPEDDVTETLLGIN